LTGLIFLNSVTTVEVGRNIYTVLPAVNLPSNLIVYLILLKLKHAYDKKMLCIRENSRRMYSVMEFWISDIVANAILLFSYLPSIIIPFFLIGWPVSRLPFLLLIQYAVRSRSTIDAFYLPLSRTYPG